MSHFSGRWMVYPAYIGAAAANDRKGDLQTLRTVGECQTCFGRYQVSVLVMILPKPAPELQRTQHHPKTQKSRIFFDYTDVGVEA